MAIKLLIYLFIFIFSSIQNKFYNIYLDKIIYEFSETNSSFIYVMILSKEQILENLKFNAYLKSDEGNNKFTLKCGNAGIKIIKCSSSKNENNFLINFKAKYYFYYSCLDNCKVTLNNEPIFEDKNKISLIFKPEISKNIVLYRDYKKIIIKHNKRMMNSGYLFIGKKSKKLLKYPQNGFNKYIEQNNYISAYKSLKEYRSINSYKEAVKLGFHILDADILFTKDKIPVICHEKNLEVISDGKGPLKSQTLNELKKLNFYGLKSKNEKILTLEEFLKFSKENNVIIDLDLYHLDYTEYFSKTEDYIKILINEIQKSNMFNSVIFNSGDNILKLTKLKQYKNDIAISISRLNDRKSIDNIKDKFNDSKIIIYNMGNLQYGKKIDKETVKYGISLGKKIKAAKVNNINFANKLFSWGVNYITTQKIYPFQLKNEKEEPIKIRCNFNMKGYSECKLGEDLFLIDNEYYNIYYSNNIFNLYEEINETPIGEFKYINTNKNEQFYYIDEYINFKEGIIKLIVSHIVPKDKIIKGIIGPCYDNVDKYFLFDFICKGNNTNHLLCVIIKEKKDKFEINEKYKIYSLDNYSYNYGKVIMNKKIIEDYKILIFSIFLIIVILLKLYKKNH